MSNLKELIRALTIDFCDIEFSVEGEPAGIEPTVTDGVPKYTCWYRDTIKDYTSADEVLNAPLFSGKSLQQIADNVDFFYV